MSSSNGSIGDQIRHGIKGIRGAGDAIRGTAMAETDKAANTQTAETTQHEALANKGMGDMDRANQQLGHDEGARNTSTAPTTTTSGPGNTATATSSGAHSVAPGSIGAQGSTTGGAAAVQEEPGVRQTY